MKVGGVNRGYCIFLGYSLECGYDEYKADGRIVR